MVHPRGHVPIDGADFIARLIFAHFIKVHALALENAVVLASQRLVHQAKRADFNLTDFFKNFARDHDSIPRLPWAKAPGRWHPRLGNDLWYRSFRIQRWEF